MPQRTLLAIAAVVVLFGISTYLLFRQQERQARVDAAPPPPVSDDPRAASADESVSQRLATDVPQSDTSRKRLDRHKGEPPPVRPLFEGWTGSPAAAIVFSGEMHGYIEPCGCSANQVGGLSRRADLLRQIRERGWPVTALDTGGLVSNPTRLQSKKKLAMALSSLKEMQYAGVALGVEEVQTDISLLEFNEDERPPFLSCNLLLFGGGVLEKPRLMLSVGEVKVGVTAVFGNSLKVKVVREGSVAGNEPPNVQLLDPQGSLTKVVAELEAEKPDLLVLLSHASLAESKQIAEQFPQFHLVVSAGGPEDPNPRPEYIGKTLLVAPGQKGKHVAVVGYFPQDDQKLRYEAVGLDGQRFKDTPFMHEQMRRYQDALAVQNLIVGEPAIDYPRNVELTVENRFVGSKVCGECHPRAYKKWLETGHAKATTSIKVGRSEHKGEYISRIHDPECVACHVTGWDPGRGDPKDYYRYKSGFEGEPASAHLVGQGCENCHGPGGRHVELERRFQKDKELTDELMRFREFVQLFADEAGGKVCVKCHDGDNDPHFKTDGDVYQEYWDEIKHPWRN